MRKRMNGGGDEPLGDVLGSALGLNAILDGPPHLDFSKEEESHNLLNTCVSKPVQC